MKKNTVAIGAIVVVIVLLGSSVGVAAVNYPVPVLSQIGKALLNLAPPAGSSLTLQGAIFNPDGTINASTGQSSSALSPLALVAPGSGGGGTGSCTTSTTGSIKGQGFGWGVSITPVYNGTASSMTITGSYSVIVGGRSTGITKTFSYSQVVPSGQKVTIKPLGEDITAGQVVTAASSTPGQYQVSISPSVSMTITYANGATVTLSGTGSGSGTVSVTSSSTTYCASALSVSAAGGSFMG